MTIKLRTHDHRNIHSEIYKMKPGPVAVLEIPAMKFVSQEMNTAYHMDWAGRPEPIDQQWVVWKVVNQLKHLTKNQLSYKFTLMPHEILWHDKNDSKSIATQMMQVPDCITDELFNEACFNVEKRLGKKLPSLKLISNESITCVQKLHIGHYQNSIEALKEIMSFADQESLSLKTSYKEIYLTPAMKCHKPETWQTVVSVETRNSGARDASRQNRI
ncbi:hypothetical protein JYA63_10805 [Fictibacillus nanhaiensis]|uniref:GyrI-like small molecule binding domain-containing protein n=2 Tax=Fictibacillus nanhaiensis TaxID=742169 RepID=A0ABS2ZQV0_9BACL|nr:hypothetical protein [Fictibacillus nanhaiensis]